MNFTRAITRTPGPNFADGITTAALGKADYGLMLRQHAAYVEVLRSLGVEVTQLDPLPAFSDAYFVEDVAVVTPEVAVITHPGAAARQGEEQPMRPVLAAFCPLAFIQPPATLEGGDVLLIGHHVFVGLSERTNQAGVQQLGEILAPFGYTCLPIPVGAGLHLKSSVSYVGKNTLLLTRDFDLRRDLHHQFSGYERIVVEIGEEYAANTLLVNHHLLTPAGFPTTYHKLKRLGFPIIEVDVSEARKMDGGLSCMSLRF